MRLNTVYAFHLMVQFVHAAFNESALSQPFPKSVISLQPERLDLFFKDSLGNVWHKNHANLETGWNPGFEFMNMTDSSDSIPIAVGLGGKQMHIFLNRDGILSHKYWDGMKWQPSEEWENLTDVARCKGNVAVVARGSDRLHVVGTDDNGRYIQKLYDGTVWLPDADWQDLGDEGFGDQYFKSEPAIIARGPDRLDVFGILSNGTLLHKYSDGHKWHPSKTGWEQYGNGFTSDPIVTSSDYSTFELWAFRAPIHWKSGVLWHRSWHERHGLGRWRSTDSFWFGKPIVVDRGVNRRDIFGNLMGYFFSQDWDGRQWNPPGDDPKLHRPGQQLRGPANCDLLIKDIPGGCSFITDPLTISWGENNLNVFAIDGSLRLQWQYVVEEPHWLPSADTHYKIGDLSEVPAILKSINSKNANAGGKKEKSADNVLLVQDAEKGEHWFLRIKRWLGFWECVRRCRGWAEYMM